MKTLSFQRFGKTKLLLIVGVLLTIIQQMPVIRDNFYQEVRIVLYTLFAFVSIVPFMRVMRRETSVIIKVFSVTILIGFLELIFFDILDPRFQSLELFELVIPYVILISAYSFNFNKEINLLTDIYAFFAVMMGIMLIYHYGGSFVIAEQYLQGVAKNQTGPILGIASIILFEKIITMTRSHSYYFLKSIWYSLLFIGGIACLLILRNRAGLVALFIVQFFIVINRLRKKPTLRSLFVITISALLILLLILSGYLNPIFNIVNMAFTLNFDLHDLNSLSADRINTYKLAVEYIRMYPAFGELTAGESLYGIAHNYILNKWVKYGLIGSLPFVLFYIYLVLVIMKNAFFEGVNLEGKKTAHWLLIYGFIISVFEYTFPFGPGTSQVMTWFMLGNYLSNRNKENLLSNR